MSKQTEQLTVAKPMASAALAAFIGMEQPMLIDTIRAQCFSKTKKVGDHYEQIEVTDFQVAAFISIAVEMRVNPLLPGMLYAYPVKGGGIVPIMGPDGVFKKLAEHPDIVSWEVEVLPEDVKLPPTHAVAKIYRKGVERPISYTALLSEWKISENPNWVSRPRHMLQLRALKHAARQVIHGLPYDEDDRHIMEEIRVSPGEPGQEAPAARPDPAALKRGKSGTSASKKEEPIDIEAKTPPEAAPSKTTEEAPPHLVAAPVALEKDKTYKWPGVNIIEAAPENFGDEAKPAWGCKANVSCEHFTGTVYDLKGAVMAAGPNGLTPSLLPAWRSQVLVTLEVVGKFSKVQKAVIAVVTSVTADEAKQGALGID